MTENNDTQHIEPTPPPPPAAPQPEQPRPRWRDRRVGVVTLTVSTIAALVIGGTFGTAAGGLVGYGIGHDDRPDRPGIARMQWPDRPQSGLPGGGMPERQLVPPNGELPPGTLPEGSEGSDDESSS